MSYHDLYNYKKLPQAINITFDIILDHVHKRLHCCGLMGTSDFTKLHIPIPPSCFNDESIVYESSCLFKFRLESVHKAQIFALCFYMMAILTLVTFLIDLILLREFLQDQLLEHVIERLTSFTNIIQDKSQKQYSSVKPEIQHYIIDYLLEDTVQN